MVQGIGDILIPLWGEEPYLGTTYAQLQQNSPKVANLFWHDGVLYGSALVVVSLMTAVLSYRGIAKGSKLSWALVMIWAGGWLISGLVAHLAIGDTYPSHVVFATIVIIILFIGLGVSAKPLFSAKDTSVTGG
jgi:hypothetical protein